LLRRVLVLPAAVSLLALTMGTASAATTTSWTLVPMPTPVGSTPAMTSVSCPSATDCVAVGLSTGAIAESWNGSAWSLMSVPQPAHRYNVQLNGVSCASADYCMAVGQGIDKVGANPTDALTELWNGSTWTIETPGSPFPGKPSGGLNAVSCVSADYCAAVGELRQGSTYYGVVDLWNGSTWTAEATLSGVKDFSSVSCPTTAGCSITDGADIAYWSGGATIATEPLAVPSGGAVPLAEAISCTAAQSCTTVGDTNAGVPLAEYWNGSGWAVQLTHVPPNTSQSNLADVSCVSASSCTAVGNEFRAHQIKESLLAEHWNGSGGWGIPATPATGSNNQFMAVSCATTVNCMAVGSIPGSSGNGEYADVMAPTS
jgi:hypothetical protein